MSSTKIDVAFREDGTFGFRGRAPVLLNKERRLWATTGDIDSYLVNKGKDIPPDRLAATRGEVAEILAAVMDVEVCMVADPVRRELVQRGATREDIFAVYVAIGRALGAVPSALPHCSRCGRPYFGRKGGATYCSDRCSGAPRNRGRTTKAGRQAAALRTEAKRKAGARAKYEEHIAKCLLCTSGKDCPSLWGFLANMNDDALAVSSALSPEVAEEMQARVGRTAKKRTSDKPAEDKPRAPRFRQP
jgi:hypothetical protein